MNIFLSFEKYKVTDILFLNHLVYKIRFAMQPFLVLQLYLILNIGQQNNKSIVYIRLNYKIQIPLKQQYFPFIFEKHKTLSNHFK